MNSHHPLPADLATGSVALDIGGGAGALLVHTGADRVGEEIELERVGEGWRTHVAVLTRRVGVPARHAAVFASLPAGDYVIRATGECVRIEDGAVTERDWRPASPPAPPPGAPPSRAAHAAATARRGARGPALLPR